MEGGGRPVGTDPSQLGELGAWEGVAWVWSVA